PSDFVIPVLTKADELPPEEVAARAHVLADSEFHRTPLAISVRTGRGLSELRDLVHQAFAYPLEIHLVLVPGAEASANIHWLYVSSSIRRMFFTNNSFEVVVMRRSNSLSFRIVSTK